MSALGLFGYGLAAFTVGWFFALMMTLILDVLYAFVEMIGDVFWH